MMVRLKMNNPEMSLQELEQEIVNLTSDSENIFSRKSERIKRELTENFLRTLFVIAERIERARISSYLSTEELDELSVKLDSVSLHVTEKLISEHFVNFDDKFLPYFIEKRKYNLVDARGDKNTRYIYARPTTDGVLAVSTKNNELSNITVKHFSPDSSGFGQVLDFYFDRSLILGNKIRCLQLLPNGEYLIAGTDGVIKFSLTQMDSWIKVAPGDNSKFPSHINVVQPMGDGLLLVGCDDGELYECDWENSTKQELIYKSANTISGIELAGDSVFVSEGFNERKGQPPFLLKRLHKNAGKWESEIISERQDTGFRKIQSISEECVQVLRWGGVDEYSINNEGVWSAETVLSSTGNFTDVQFLPNGRFLWNMENAKTRKIACGFHGKNRKGIFVPAIQLDNYGKVVPLRDGKLVAVTDGEMRLYDGEIANAKQ